MRTLLKGTRWILQGRSATAATFQTFFTRLLILAINMATGITTARFLAPTGRGELAAMTMWAQFLAYAMTLGLPVALVYNLKRYPEKKSEIFSAALVLSTGMGFVAMLTGIVFIPYWLSKYSPEVIFLAQCFMVTAPLALASVTFTAAFEAEGKFTTSNQVAYLIPLSTLVMLGAFAVSRTLTPLTAGLAYQLPGIPVFFWMLVQLWKRYQPRWRSLGESCQKLLNYGLRAYGMDLLGTVSGQIDQILVVGLLAPASMGMYAVALSLSRMLSMFENSILKVLFPTVAARPPAEVVAVTGRAARMSLALTLLAAIPLMLVGPFLLKLLYGADFLGAVPVFRILLVEIVLACTDSILAQAFMALGRPGTLTILQGITLGLNLALLPILIPTYGLRGAGIALLISTIIRLILILACYPLLLKVRPPSLIINREDLQFLYQKWQAIRG
ncbi:MAG: oligosaccharide flippase family protein [Nostocaceae cyanobacterium]|nr:oligosaccharide flippase family protein [Nostocaceae cyanobacterium]